MTVSRPVASPIARNVCKNIAILSNEGGLSLPPGAIGAWYAENYDATRIGIPNSVASSQVMPSNILNAPRRIFGTAYAQANCTITDSNQVGPDWLTEASTVSWGSADAYINIPSISYPAGTYTVALEVATTDGSTVSFRLGKIGAETTVQATGTWSTVSSTFTHAGGGFTGTIVRSLNSSTPASLKICNARMFAGSSDLGAESLRGHMLFGRGPYDSTLPSYSSGVVTFNGANKYGLIQLPSSYTLNAFTAICVGQRKAAAGGGTVNPFLSKIGSGWTEFSPLYCNGGNGAETRFNNGTAISDLNGLWTYKNDQWNCHATRYNGSQISVFLDGCKAKTASQTGSVTIADLWSHVVLSTAIYSRYAMQSIVLYDRALSDDEVLQATQYLNARASDQSITVGTTRWLCPEGDSITYGTGATSSQGYARVFGANSSPSVVGFVPAIAGSTIADVESRASVVDSMIPSNKYGKQFVLSLLIGANDFPYYASGSAAYAARVAAYLAARKAAGWDKTVLCTVLPKVGAAFLTARNTFNSIVTGAGWASTNNIDAICDFAANATVGADGAASNTTYYPDNIHPSDAAVAILEPIYRATINAL